MANKPDYRVSTFRETGQTGEDGKPKVRWTELGAAWVTKNGNIRVELEGNPVNGKLILMKPKDEDSE